MSTSEAVDNGLVTQADLDWWFTIAPGLAWRFARTMPETPHSYVVRNETLPHREFIRAVKVIRAFGEPGKFYDHTNIYLVDPTGSTKWWTMGEPLEHCNIINVATTERVYGKQDAPHTYSGHRSVYDALAPIYDRRYTTAEAHHENIEVWRMVTNRFRVHPTMLDVGCGTGLSLDLNLTRAKKFVGIDPSQAMLNELIRKHRDVHDVIPARIEDVVDDLVSEGRSFDLVCGLFGSPSYFEPDAIRALPALTEKMLLLMHYEPGYLPDYWEQWDTHPDHLDESRQASLSLLDDYPGTFTRLNRFHVVTLHLDWTD